MIPDTGSPCHSLPPTTTPFPVSFPTTPNSPLPTYRRYKQTTTTPAPFCLTWAFQTPSGTTCLPLLSLTTSPSLPYPRLGSHTFWGGGLTGPAGACPCMPAWVDTVRQGWVPGMDGIHLHCTTSTCGTCPCRLICLGGNDLPPPTTTPTPPCLSHRFATHTTTTTPAHLGAHTWAACLLPAAWEHYTPAWAAGLPFSDGRWCSYLILFPWEGRNRTPLCQCSGNTACLPAFVSLSPRQSQIPRCLCHRHTGHWE